MDSFSFRVVSVKRIGEWGWLRVMGAPMNDQATDAIVEL
jgi:hypothetical protein